MIFLCFGRGIMILHMHDGERRKMRRGRRAMKGLTWLLGSGSAPLNPDSAPLSLEDEGSLIAWLGPCHLWHEI